MKLLTDMIALISPTGERPPAFRPLTDLPLIILVGLTGVGKSTVISLLRSELDFTLLPDRRKITDDLIIMSLQEEDGYVPAPVTDRVKRFEYTARYRAKHPGGMAHALSRLAIDPARAASLILFDGLRGLNEVQYATGYFPQARFIVLDAPDIVRLGRLLKRADTFDTTKLSTSLQGQNIVKALSAIANIEAVFTEEQLRQIGSMAYYNDLSIEDVVKKASIIVEERRNYDSSTARVYLASVLPPKQVLVIDTAAHSPEAVAGQIKEWLKANP
jgi:dephospho-CoA kinase